MSIQLTNNELHYFLNEHFSYYRSLDQHWQKVFVSRVLRFIDSKYFFGADGFEITNEVRVLIAASAVQLTLGLNIWDYDYFIHIIIHPGIFENKHTRLLQKGETNLQGHIRFSWKSFVKGYQNTNDNINLGIHEFTHALRFNSIRGNPQDYFVKYFFLKWIASAMEAYRQIRQGKDSIFRKYGGSNLHEFTSVCFEHYFESPEEIKGTYPQLYYNTAILLNQYTDANKTHIIVRNQMLEEVNKLYCPMKERVIKASFTNYNTISLIVIVFILLFITSLRAGLFSGPSFILGLLLVFYYFRLERNHITLKIHESTITVSKGLYFLKNWQRHTILLSQFVNFHFTQHDKNTDLIFIYYNTDNDFFYEESMECKNEDIIDFKKELWANKIAVNKI